MIVTLAFLSWQHDLQASHKLDHLAPSKFTVSHPESSGSTWYGETFTIIDSLLCLSWDKIFKESKHRLIIVLCGNGPKRF
jgi:hypothetical protein